MSVYDMLAKCFLNTIFSETQLREKASTQTTAAAIVVSWKWKKEKYQRYKWHVCDKLTCLMALFLLYKETTEP